MASSKKQQVLARFQRSESEGFNNTLQSPSAPAAGCVNLACRTPIRSLGRKKPAGFNHDDTALFKSAGALHCTKAMSSPSHCPAPEFAEAGLPPQRLVDLTTRTARERKYSILHPDAALPCAAADVSEQGDCAHSMHFDDDHFEANADGPTSLPAGACGAQLEAASARSAFSAENAATIANVFLEVVRTSCIDQDVGGDKKQTSLPARSLLKHRPGKENKDAKKQLASIIKTKAAAAQPVEEYEAARFAKRMQLYNPISLARSSISLSVTKFLTHYSLPMAQVRCAEQRAASRWRRPQQNIRTFVKCVKHLNDAAQHARRAGSRQRFASRLAAAQRCGSKFMINVPHQRHTGGL
jgi:hypothetical protein